MKSKFLLLIFPFIALFSCTKPDSGQTGGDKTQDAPKAIASYCFEGDSTSLYHAYFLDMEVSYVFAFTGGNGEKVNVGLRKELLGRTISPADYYHNDDYLFCLETEELYYSQYHALKGGSSLISEEKNNGWTINLDLILADGSNFKLNYSGPFENSTEDEN